MWTSGREAEVRPPANKLDGVNVVGYLKTGVGLGEAARGYVSALKAAGVPVATRQVREGVPPGVEVFDIGGDEGGPTTPDEGETEALAPYSTNLVCVNADHMPLLYEEVGEAFFEDRRTIGVWAWETNSFPKEFLASFGLVDELWVYSSYVAGTLGRISPVPVVVVPPPVAMPDPGPHPAAVAAGLGIPEGFTFLFVFDFYGASGRKNPFGLVEAFKRAFAPGEGPQLVLKSIHGSHWPEFLSRLESAAHERPDIHVVDRYVSLREKTALMASCDCYVSLHRAEGFGLTMAEAMALGKPVIATGYSGNLDFMNSSNSYLVDYTMTQIGEGLPPYSGAGGAWAEPDLEHAARLMRRVWEDQEEARARGERARRDVEGMLSPEAVGQIALARLERLAELPVRPKVPPVGVPPANTVRELRRRLRVVESILEQGPAVESSSRLGRVGRLARRLVLRGIRPFTSYQRRLDSALINALRETRRSIATLGKTRQSVEEAVYLNLVRRQVQIEKEVRARDEALNRRIEELSAELRRLGAEPSEIGSNLSEEATSDPLAAPDADYRS